MVTLKSILNLKSLMGLCFAIAGGMLFSSPVAHAFIPSSKTIVGRLTHNNGKGAYTIDQDVMFRTSTDPVILHEHWVVENGENMRVTVSSPKASTEAYHFDAIYRGGNRLASDFHGGFHNAPVSGEFIETFFHQRSTHGFLEALVHSGVLPPSIMRERPHTGKDEELKLLPEPLVRLGRYGGVVDYVLGEATPVNASAASPGVWIDQDAFFLRRLRFASDAEVVASNPMQANSLKLPRERTVSWDGNSVLIRVISVKSIPSSKTGAFLNSNSLTSADAKAARLPEQAQVKEFYTRFR